MKMLNKLALVALPLTMTSTAFAQQAEVVHYWTSSSEAASLKVISDEFQKRGGAWVDNPVPGFDAARAVAQSRAAAQDPPTAMAWLLGQGLKQLGDENLLGDTDDLALWEKWDEHLPPAISALSKYNGKYVAAPLNVHGTNWLWYNTKILAESNTTVPTTWKAFIEEAPKIKQAGYTPLALGGQPWQETYLFMAVALGSGGSDWFKKAFVDQDADALRAPELVESFRTFLALKPFVDEGSPGRDWNVATQMLIKGQAAFQIMGTWAKGEFQAAKMKPEVDFGCSLAPGSTDHMVFITDTFVFFKTNAEEDKKAQDLLASVSMDPDVQSRYNMIAGSNPARTDASLDGYDSCAVKAGEYINTPDALIPTGAMALPDSVNGAITDAVSNAWNAGVPAEQAAQQLIDAVAAVAKARSGQ